MTHFATISRLLVGVSGVSMLMASPALAQEQVYRFNIPAQPLDRALRTVAHQARTDILFDRQDVADRRSAPLSGSYTAEDAFRRVIGSAPLAIDRGSQGAFTLHRSNVATSRQVSALRLPAQSASPSAAGDPVAMTQQDQQEPAQDIVVTGIRESLEKAAAIKKNAVQVVDSVVAEDIGKFPDPTTAAALQRVPGVQVAVDQSNQITGVKIRGLGDILSTLDGREIFTTTGRTFSFADLPAGALARVDVVKSMTADLIEGGVAGIVDLQLQKPFNFNKPAVSVTARGNYGLYSKKADPQVNVFATDTWHTGIGDIGALLNVGWSRTHYNHPRTREGVRRSMATGPFNLPGVLAPNVSANNGERGTFDRPEANATIQWQPTDRLKVTLDGLYTGYREHSGSYLYTANFFNNGTTVSDVVTDPDECITARVRPNGQTPQQIPDPNPDPNRNPNDPAPVILQPYSVQNLCNLKSATFNNVLTQQGTTATVDRSNLYLGAIGFQYDFDHGYLKGDFSYQRSDDTNEAVTATLGRRVATWDYETNTGNGARNTVTPGVGGTDGIHLSQGFTDNYSESVGSMLAGRVDGSFDIDSSFLKKMQFGARYSSRKANFNRALVNVPVPADPNGNDGSLGILVSDTDLPSDFYGLMPTLDRLNDGERALIPNAAFLNSESGRDTLRGLFGVPLGTPAFDPTRHFDAAEKTWAFYAQMSYEIPIGGLTLDGIVGVRPTRTTRTIHGFSKVTDTDGNTIAVPASGTKTDTSILPNASARLAFGGGLQLRASYSVAIRRPDFSALNPGVTYTLNTNPNLIPGGSAGNPNLLPQQSTNYDLSLEYYFRHGFLAVAAYKHDLKNRVISQADAETIDGVIYAISRPRNVSSAALKGIEVSGQAFLDFLPGALSGLGVMGNFTLADTRIKGDDPLAGYALQGVSKYNYNAGLIYEKGGLSSRLIYTYRSHYYDGDETLTPGVREIVDTSRTDDPNYIPSMLNYVKPSGRLDASISYNITPAIRVDFGATNILRSHYWGYYMHGYITNQFRFDDTTYSLGVRVQI